MGILRRQRRSYGPFPISLQAWVCWIVLSLAAAGCVLPVSQTPPAAAPTLVEQPPSSPVPELTLLPSATPFLPRPTPTLTASPTPTPAPTPTPVNAIPHADRTRYRLDVVFDYQGHSLEVEQEVFYPNLTGESLADLVLIVDSIHHGAAFELAEINWEGGEPVTAYTLERTTLTLILPEALPPGEQVGVTLKYNLQLPGKPAALGYSFRETILIDWYPFIPPYKSGQGWLVNRPWPFGEYLSYALGDYEVTIRLADSNPEVIVAAGAPDLEPGDAWHYRLDAARSFAWSASTLYEVLTRQAGEVSLTAYVSPEHRAAGEAALQTAAEALALYSELFGRYPRPAYTLVEADFADGREYDGLIFLSRAYHAEYDGTRQNFLTLLAAHETAHQWWYGLVGNDQAGEPWLDEALSTYSEFLFFERYHPELASWWWFYRVNFFRPQGPVNLPLYNFGSFNPYWHAVYMRGALFLRDLRAVLGDEAFFNFLQEYARQTVYREATAADFFSLLEKTSPADTRGVVDAYFSPRYLPEQ